MFRPYGSNLKVGTFNCRWLGDSNMQLTEPFAPRAEAHQFVRGQYVVIHRRFDTDRLARNRDEAAMLHSMCRGDIDGVIDALRALGVEIVRLH